jgi:hypothetical protein
VIRRHPVVAFFVLAYAIAWVGWPLWASGVLAEPLFLPCGPLVAALVVIAVTEGKAGLRLLGARMVRWRVGALWWAVALGHRAGAGDSTADDDHRRADARLHPAGLG